MSSAVFVHERFRVLVPVCDPIANIFFQRGNAVVDAAFVTDQVHAELGRDGLVD
jgi:hypothetical protein